MISVSCKFSELSESPVISLAAAFACAVTCKTCDENSLVARNGSFSLFSAYKTVLPEVSLSTILKQPSSRLVTGHFLRPATKDHDDTLKKER